MAMTDPLPVALERAGFNSVPGILHLEEFEMDTLNYKSTDADGTEIISEVPRGIRKNIVILQCYYGRQRELGTRMSETSWEQVTTDDFDDFRLNEHYYRLMKAPGHGMQSPTPISATTAPPTSSNKRQDPLYDFKRGIRRDQSLFPKLKDDRNWHTWNLDFRAQARAQDVDSVLDEQYIPTTTEEKALFNEKQKFVYAVFTQAIHTDQGKTFVRKYEASSNAQAIYKELSNHASISTKASIEATTLLQYITTAKLGDGRWKGTTNGFVLNWINQIRKLESITPTTDHLSEGQKKSTLEIAVSGISELRNVKTQEDQHKALTGVTLGFEQYVSLLLSATTAYDNSISNSGKRGQVRQVYHANRSPYDVDTDVGDLISTDDSVSIEDAIQAHYRRLKLNKNQWSRLSSDAQSKWDEFDEETKNIILEQKRPPDKPAPTNTSSNLHRISAFEYLAQLHDTVDTKDSASTPSQLTANESAKDDILIAKLHEQYKNFQVHESQQKPTKMQPGDISRLLSTKLAKKDASDDKGKEINIDGVKYRQVNMAKLIYHASPHRRIERSSLIDRGCNGGICGDDVRIVAKIPDRTVDIQGIDNHQIRDIPIVTAGGVVKTQLGEILVIMNQYAYAGKGKTIHSSGQLEMHGMDVNEKSRKIPGGLQRIKTPDGYVIPLNIRSGLPYMTMRPYTDHEWEALPHVHITGDDTWNPTILDSELDDDEKWFDAISELPPEQPLFDDAGNYKYRVTVNHASINDPSLDDYLLPSNPIQYEVYERTVKRKEPDYSALRPKFGWSTKPDVIKRTFDATTQLARMPMSPLLTRHFKSPFPALNVKRRHEPVATDTIYSDTAAIDSGDTQAQFYVGTETLVMDAYGMKTDSQFVNSLEDNIRQRGAMDKLLSDSAQVETGKRAHDLLRGYVIGNWQSEPHQQQQNPAERHYQTAKRMTNNVMERSGSPANTWLLALLYVCFLLNHLAHARLDYRTPIERLTGTTPDISPLLRFHWWEPVYYKIDDTSFPSDSREKRGHFVGIAEHVGHAMTFKILTDDTHKILYRSNVRSAHDPDNPNIRADLFSGEATKEFIRSGRMNSNENEPIPMMIIQPEDMIGRTYLTKPQEDGQRFRARIVEAIQQHEGQVANDPTLIKFRCSVNDDQFEEIVAYNDLIHHIETDQAEEGVWKYKKIVGHEGPLSHSHPNYRGSTYNVMLEWEAGERTFEPLSIIATDDPVTCAIYARDHGLLEQAGWKRFKRLALRQKKLFWMANQAKLRSFRLAPKYQYGFEVPRDYAHACTLDTQAGNEKWKMATIMEMDQLDEYDTFIDKGHAKSNKPPDGFKKIRVHLVYAVKFDGRHKARCVGDGHLTEIPVDSVYSGVVSLRGLRTLIFLAELNNLATWATDIGNAYLEATTSEKLYIIAGPEFGSEREGHILVIYKALYGLRTSGLRWHERLAVVLRAEGFKPCLAEPDIWMREHKERRIYEYIAVYVDDLAFAMVNPTEFINTLREKYKFKLKGTGDIEFHLGCDFFREEDGTLCMAPKKYIERMVDGYERMFGEKPSLKALSPLEKGDHPEIDTSELLDAKNTSKYQSLVGSMQWAVSLGRFDIATAVMTLSGFRAAPRFGHLERAKRTVGYLSKMKQAAIRFRTGQPDYSDLPDPVYDWEQSVYGDVKEALPHNAPVPLGKAVTLTHYVDANLYHDILTGRSVTGIIHLYNQCPIAWYSKKQATTETATYGSEYVASRTCVEQVIDARNTLRYLGVPIEGKSYMFGDNESVVNSSMKIDSKLHKRHIALSFHRVRESIAAKIIGFFHIPGPMNPADVVSKHWGYQAVWQLLRPLLFWKGDTSDIPRDQTAKK